MPLRFFGHPSQHCSDAQMGDQQVAWGLYLQDLATMLPAELQQLASRYAREFQPSSTSQSTGVSSDGNGFQASLDVQEFKPEEISVRVEDNTVIVEGKHEEKEDEHGSISRHFVRKYKVSGEFDLSKVESRLSSNGVLRVMVPKNKNSEDGVTVIPVVHSGTSSDEEKKKE